MITSPHTLDCLKSDTYASARTVCITKPKCSAVSKKYTHADLVSLGERWLLNTQSCSFVLSELHVQTNNNEIPDNIGFKSQTTILIECKTSRSDFHSDKRKMCRRRPHKGMGDFRFFLCPANIIMPKDLPKGWGLLWAYPSGTVRQKVGPARGAWHTNPSNPFFFVRKDTISESQMMVSALRRLYLRGVLPSIYENPYIK